MEPAVVDSKPSRSSATDTGEEPQRRDEMSVMCLRMHVAVAGDRKRLDAEIEIVDIGAVNIFLNLLEALAHDPPKCERFGEQIMRF
jgi:hypothetical protein